MISVYDNPTEVDSDAMATMFVYYQDQNFRWPARAGRDLSNRSSINADER